ncbi:hypothetical protein [Desulfosarcina alkanivorans]|uniref:hypothetical protein n=1 Tax=Desulfosarcina alkanivorans TaxID=571177 RepID=UPI0012D3006E|nr:hypothetical protein [Desulfosarcina alkanivorans]
MTNRLLSNENGSVMVLVLMVLAIMTVIGIVASNTVITENSIIRNVGIYKQNASLLDSSLMRGLQEFLQIPDNDPDNFTPALSVWINDVNNDPPSVGDPEEFINTIWYESTFTQRCLNAANSNVADSLPILADRGEDLNDNLRYAVVGWEVVDLGTSGSESMSMGKPVWHQGRILGEYVSLDAGGDGNGNGLMRMEIGVKRMW